MVHLCGMLQSEAGKLRLKEWRRMSWYMITLNIIHVYPIVLGSNVIWFICVECSSPRQESEG